MEAPPWQGMHPGISIIVVYTCHECTHAMGPSTHLAAAQTPWAVRRARGAAARGQRRPPWAAWKGAGRSLGNHATSRGVIGGLCVLSASQATCCIPVNTLGPPGSAGRRGAGCAAEGPSALACAPPHPREPAQGTASGMLSDSPGWKMALTPHKNKRFPAPSVAPPTKSTHCKEEV